MKSRKSFLLRIDPNLYEALEAWAQQEFRSVNGQIEYLLKDAVRRQRRLKLDETDQSSTSARDQVEGAENRGPSANE
jgi:hypothetical protein